jgi:hypothetical protein
MLTLSKRWGERLSNLPETGMGYQVATVVLKDGREFPQTRITEAVITKIRGLNEIPFTEEEIADIIITHDKWDWNQE